MSQTPLYHERQVMQLCGIHSLNNLLQQRVFTKQDFDLICQRLSPNTWVNPHRSVIGIGNYDVNVLITALQQQQLELVWFDRRKPVNCIKLENVTGFILNVLNSDHQEKSLFSLCNYFRSRNHWLAIRQIDSVYYNLDSKRAQPLAIGNETQLVDYLEAERVRPNCELFIVVTNELSGQLFFT